MKKFKFKTICRQAAMIKESGYGVSEILTLMIIFPLRLLNTASGFYKIHHRKATEMKKDVIWHLKNNEKMPWRKLLYSVCKEFQ